MATRDPDDPRRSERYQGGEAGVGEPLTAADQRWQQAAAELEPARSLARAEDRAKQLVGIVSLVGVLLGGLGLVAAARLQMIPLARWLAIVTVALALAGVVLALWTLLLREQTVRPNDLEAVRRWYAAQFGRARLVRVAGLLLLGAVLLAGAAGLVALLASRSPRPVVEVAVSGTGPKQTAKASVRWPGLQPTRLVTVTITTTGANGPVIAQGLATPDQDGTAAVTLEAVKPQGVTRVVVSMVAGRQSCATTMTLIQSGARQASDTLACQHT